MRKSRAILILILVFSAALIGAVLLVCSRDQGPSYDGGPLSRWVLVLQTSQDGDDEFKKATNAIDHIGTNALPYLVRWIRHEPAQWRYRIAGVVQRVLPSSHFRDKVASSITQPERVQLAYGTCKAFGALGSKAVSAIPELSRLMDPGGSTAFRATRALCCLGTNALPSLLAVLKNPEHPGATFAVCMIGFMPGLSNAAQSVTLVLIPYLSGTNYVAARVYAARILTDLKCDPNLSVPPLAASLASPDPRFRYWSARALEAIGPEAVGAIPGLTNALADTNALVGDMAARALHKIAPQQFAQPTSPLPTPISLMY